MKRPFQKQQTERAARLSGSWQARSDDRPNLRGSIVLEQALPKGTRLWVSGWTKPAGGKFSGIEYVSLSLLLADRARGERGLMSPTSLRAHSETFLSTGDHRALTRSRRPPGKFHSQEPGEV